MKKFLVIGNPIDHSLSPKLHNYWIKNNNIKAVYDKQKLNENDLEKIYFNKEGEYEENLPGSTEYFIPVDMVICENGIARPKKELQPLVGNQDQGSEKKISIGL